MPQIRRVELKPFVMGSDVHRNAEAKFSEAGLSQQLYDDLAPLNPCQTGCLRLPSRDGGSWFRSTIAGVLTESIRLITLA